MTQILNARQCAVIPIAAFTASGNMTKLTNYLHRGLDSGWTINELKEVLTQLYAYVGFPRSLNGLNQLMKVVDTRQAQGITDATGPVCDDISDKSALDEGTENQTRLVGRVVTGRLFDFAPDIDRYLKSHLFGDIFRRKVIDWSTRELVTIAALANLSEVDEQLAAHLRISRHNGLSNNQLWAFVGVLDAECGEMVAAHTGQILASVLSDVARENNMRNTQS